MRNHTLTFILVAIFGVTSLAIAQTGGNFSLVWSSINSGGQTSTGGSFAVSSTLGQPTTGTATGGDFELNSGFQQCFTESPSVISTADNGVDLALDWTGNNANIYRASNDPFFTPSSPIASNVPPAWKDIDALTANENYTYLIRNLNNCGESANSMRIGTFKFELEPGN